MSKRKQLWVDERFYRDLKAQAALQGLSVIEYTKRLGKDAQVAVKEYEKKFNPRL